MTKISLPTFSSFESICASFSVPNNSFSFFILTIYRPPDPNKKSVFISEFYTLLEDLATSNSDVIITGDFNYHVDKPDSSTSQFLNLLADFSLTQHINFPTHSFDHTLDLLITRSSSTIISSVDSTDPALSDHYALLFSIFVPKHSKPKPITKLI